jgi:GTPase SAR1 family protein
LLTLLVVLLASVVCLAQAWFYVRSHQSVLLQLHKAYPGLVAVETMERKLQSRWAWFLLLPYFIALQCIESVLVLHRLLLRQEKYQLFATKLLRMRIERALEEESVTPKEGESEFDTSYERWFDPQIPPANHLLIPTEFVLQVEDRLSKWLEGSSTEDNALVITGDEGSGKTVLAKQLMEKWSKADSHQVCYHSIDEKLLSEQAVFDLVSGIFGQKIEKITDLIALDTDLAPTIVIVDRLENTFIADVGGFQGFKTLMSFSSLRMKNVYWIMLSNYYSWNYLRNALERSYYFTQDIRLPRWNAQDIKNLILTRHKSSRRKLAYSDLFMAVVSDDQHATFRAAETRCFNLLWEQCVGNPRVALSLWAASVSKKARFHIEVGVPERPQAEQLAGLRDDSFFVLAALVIHEGLSTELLVRVTHMEEPVIRRSLKVLMDLGCVYRCQDGVYRLNALWYFPTSVYLKRRNFIYG